MSGWQSIDAEENVLGAILLDNTALPRIRSLMPDGRPFSHAARGATYNAMLGLYDRGSSIDPVTVSETIGADRIEQIGGVDRLISLDQIAATSVNIEHHVHIVLDKARRRDLQSVLRGALERLSNGDDGREVSTDLQARLLQLSPTPKHETWLGEAVHSALAEAAEPTKKRRFPTGLGALDQSLGDLCGGHLIVVAARPGMGKTALALNIATHIARAATVVMFSLEMPAGQLATRALAAEACVDSRAVEQNRLTRAEVDRLLQGCESLQERSMVINDSGQSSIHDIRATCARLGSTGTRPLGAVVIDYLQLMDGRGASREQVVARNSRQLKALAKQFDVPVILLSQLNRAVEQRPNRRPVLSDLRESGAIEQDADIVLMLYRDEYYNADTPDQGIAEAIIAKHRHGPTGTVRLQFHPAWSLFTSPDGGHRPPC